MNGVGNKFLTGTRFAADQHRGVPLGHLADLFKHTAHLRGASNHVIETVVGAHGPTQAITLVSQITFLFRHLPGETYALSNEIGDHFEKTRALLQLLLAAVNRLSRQYTHHIAFADLDRHSDKRQTGVIDAETIEKIRLGTYASGHHLPTAGQDVADNPLTGTVTDFTHPLGFHPIERHNRLLAGVGIFQCHHPELHTGKLMQFVQHTIKGFVQV